MVSASVEDNNNNDDARVIVTFISNNDSDNNISIDDNNDDSKRQQKASKKEDDPVPINDSDASPCSSLSPSKRRQKALKKEDDPFLQQRLMKHRCVIVSNKDKDKNEQIDDEDPNKEETGPISHADYSMEVKPNSELVAAAKEDAKNKTTESITKTLTDEDLFRLWL